MIPVQHSIETERKEEALRNSGRNYTALTYLDGKIYLGDGRFASLDRNNVMVDVASLLHGMSKGKSVDEVKAYSNAYLTMYEDYEKIYDAIEGTAIPARDVAGRVAGAAGDQSLTHYETIKKTAEMMGNVIGQERILEDLNAVNIAEKVSTSGLKGEYINETSSLLKVQQEIGDFQIPSPLRQAFSIGEKEIFADATSWVTSLRDKDSKVDLMARFTASIPGMFLQSKHDKVITILNAQAGGVNIADITAVSGNFYTNKAATIIKTAEKAIEKYSGEFIMIAGSDVINAIYDNARSALQANADNGKEDTAKSGTLPQNKRVTWFETDDMTAESFVLAKKGSYMKWLQGMTLETTFDDVRSPGAPKQKFWFDFNGFEVTQILASYKGLTALS